MVPGCHGSGHYCQVDYSGAEEAKFGSLGRMTIKRGDIIQLGPHRLMCGDASNEEDVRLLFSGKLADMVVTSPPYLQKRSYGQAQTAVADWQRLAVYSLSRIPCQPECQILVNLGMCHKNNEWIPYWDGWLGVMRNYGWRRFGLYVWDTNLALPGQAHGRLLPRHEFIFHLNRKTKMPHKIVKTKCGGIRKVNGTKVATSKKAHGVVQDWVGRPIQMTKPLDSIVMASRSGVKGISHPAKFPKALPDLIIRTYSDPGTLVYDPFTGSGTTILAADDSGRQCLGMEIEPDYCQIAVDRYWRHKEKQAKI